MYNSTGDISVVGIDDNRAAGQFTGRGDLEAARQYFANVCQRGVHRYVYRADDPKMREYCRLCGKYKDEED